MLKLPVKLTFRAWWRWSPMGAAWVAISINLSCPQPPSKGKCNAVSLNRTTPIKQLCRTRKITEGYNWNDEPDTKQGLFYAIKIENPVPISNRRKRYYWRMTLRTCSNRDTRIIPCAQTDARKWCRNNSSIFIPYQVFGCFLNVSAYLCSVLTLIAHRCCLCRHIDRLVCILMPRLNMSVQERWGSAFVQYQSHSNSDN